MTIIEMREKRAKLWNTMEGFLDTHRNDKGVLSAEDDATYANMEKDLSDLTNEIRRMERRDAMEAELSKPVNQPITAQPERHQPEKQGRASNAYKEDFGRHLRGKAPIHNVLSESVDQDGGYIVPEEFERDIVTGLDSANVIRSIAKVITTHNDRKIPIAVGRSSATWTAENDPYTESNPTFGQKEIDAHKLTDLIRVSVELLQDAAFPLEQYIANEFARAFGIAEEQAFCVGTGVGQPTGIFTENGGKCQITAAASNAITADELINLIYTLKAPYRRNAKFLMNDATIPYIRRLKDGNGVYLWQPSLQAGEPDKLLGYDLYTSPYAPTMAAGAFTIAFGDFKNYWVGDRAGRTVQRLNAFGVAGLMGNLYAESGLRANNLQNSFEKKLGLSDDNYTLAVDSGAYGNFVKDKAGYGLAQWTFWSRKQELLDFAKNQGKSIGDLQIQLDFLWKELNDSYPAVLTVLREAEKVKEASDAVLLWYERPADTSDVVQEKRAGYGQGYYDKYAGKPADSGEPSGEVIRWYRVRKAWADSKSQKGAYKILDNAKKCADQNTGYKVFDADGKVVYEPKVAEPAVKVPFLVRVSVPDLNIRTGPGTDYPRTGMFTGIGTFTIVEVKGGKGSSEGWGRLKSGAGWIALSLVKRV